MSCLKNVQNQQHSVTYRTIDEAHGSQRIDNYLITQLKGVPKPRIYRCLRKGEVRVNKKRVSQTYRLQVGDEVRIPPIRTAKAAAVPRVAVSWQNKLESMVLYEDEGFLVLNKPSGVPVHGGTAQSWGVIDAMSAIRADCRFLELVHRLDKGTSGCLLMAKKRAVLKKLQEGFKIGQVKKQYLTLLKGRWQGGEQKIRAPLIKKQFANGNHRVFVSEEGKPCKSLFQPVKVGDKASLMRVQLHTGRTHQIRVHAVHLGYPVAGDEKYGCESFNRFCQGQGLNRLFLHAEQLSFPHPITGEQVTFTAPLPDELNRVNFGSV